MVICESLHHSCFASPAQHAYVTPYRNLDHFFLIDVNELDQDELSFRATKLNAASLAEELHKDFSDLPKTNKLKLEDYVVVNVAPSVVPTYLPGIRVFR
jgi:endopolyphosphatase